MICRIIKVSVRVILHITKRSSNSCLSFFKKICRTGQYIISGNADGIVSIWDSTLPPVNDDSAKEATLQPIMKFVAHGDFVNGARYNNL